MPTNLKSLQERLGYQFRDEGLLLLALTHPSVAHERSMAVAHNQRLEFLGDAVLQLVLTRELYDRFPGFGEGPLTKARAQLVNRHSLGALARSLELGAHLILSRGEESSGGRERESTLADAYESVLGAIYMDSGFDAASGFINRQFVELLEQGDVIPRLDNPKGELQEFLQENTGIAPTYELTSISGPDHDRVFECAVYHRGVEMARGTGKNKKAAESEAAARALEVFRKNAPGLLDIPVPSDKTAPLL